MHGDGSASGVDGLAGEIEVVVDLAELIDELGGVSGIGASDERLRRPILHDAIDVATSRCAVEHVVEKREYPLKYRLVARLGRIVHRCRAACVQSEHVAVGVLAECGIEEQVILGQHRL